MLHRRTLPAIALLLAPSLARAAWPDRPIRLVVPFAAGTTTDVIARLVGAALAKGLGQPVVADNRAGAGGTIGAQAVASAPADGYTLLFGTSGTMATNPAIMPNLAYDPIRDFAPIARVAGTSVVLAVRTPSPIQDFSEFLAAARKQPLAVGNSGTGTTGHLTTALIALRTGVPLNAVAYRDGGRAIADLLNGTLDAMVYHPLGFLPQIRAGALRPLAVTGTARHPLFPAVPTLLELGLQDAVVEGWWALYAPAGTPAPIVARLNALVVESLADPATRDELVRQGLVVQAGTPAQLAADTARELAAQRALAKAANITPD
jgi:tripartite-type tricarboxylate transporter receptor subunit TctC